MLPRRRMATFCAVAIAAATTAAVPMVATAADSGRGDGENARAAAREAVTATATCPAGKTAIAGGYSDRAGANLTANYRSAPDTWTVREPYVAPSNVYVVCSKNIDPVVVEVTGDAPAEAAQQLALTARCPSGFTPISGGWSFGNEDIDNSPVYTSRPVQRGWKIRAFFNDQSSTLTAFAYCAQRAERSTVVMAAGEPAGEDGSATAAVECSDGQRVLGGGFSTSPKSDYFNDNGPDFFYNQSQPTGRSGWQVQAVNYGQTGTATVYATCAG